MSTTSHNLFVITQDGKAVSRLQIDCDRDGVVAHLEGLSAPTRYPNMGVALDASMEWLGQAVIHRPELGGSLFLVAAFPDGTFRHLGRVYLQGNQILELLSVEDDDLSDSESPRGTSWPVDPSKVRWDSRSIALAELRKLEFDLDLLRPLQGEQPSGEGVATWGTIVVDNDKKQAAWTVYRVLQGPSGLNITAADGDSRRELVGREGMAFADLKEAYMHVASEHEVLLRLARDTGVASPAVVARFSIEEQGIRPMSASYMMEEFRIEEAWAPYRTHAFRSPFVARW